MLSVMTIGLNDNDKGHIGDMIEELLDHQLIDYML